MPYTFDSEATAQATIQQGMLMLLVPLLTYARDTTNTNQTHDTEASSGSFTSDSKPSGSFTFDTEA